MNGEKLSHQRRILKNNDTISCGINGDGVVLEFRNYCCSHTELPPAALRKYHCGKMLGCGSSGKVYRVHEYHNNEAYAMKIIVKKPFSHRTMDPRREASIMEGLKHPCVIQMHDIIKCDTPRLTCIVLELMNGGNLWDRIRKYTRIPEGLTKLYIYLICKGIKYLHDKNISHRDITPDNILFATNDDETLVKLSDFGLSKEGSEMHTKCGTPYFTAPEVSSGQKYTNKVDIWSLGVVIFVCLNGFSSEVKPADSIEFKSSKWNGISDEAKSLVKSILTKNVDSRPTIDQVLEHEWFNGDSKMKRKADELMGLSEEPSSKRRKAA